MNVCINCGHIIDPQDKAKTRTIMASMYEHLHAYAVDAGTENSSVWNALKAVRAQLWPELGPDPDDPRTDQDNDQDQ